MNHFESLQVIVFLCDSRLHNLIRGAHNVPYNQERINNFIIIIIFIKLIFRALNASSNLGLKYSSELGHEHLITRKHEQKTLKSK